MRHETVYIPRWPDLYPTKKWKCEVCGKEYDKLYKALFCCFSKEEKE